MAELDRQLSQESAQAGHLQLSALTSAKRRKETENYIDIAVREICELGMEVDDLACLQHQQKVESEPCQKVSRCTSHTCKGRCAISPAKLARQYPTNMHMYEVIEGG